MQRSAAPKASFGTGRLHTQAGFKAQIYRIEVIPPKKNEWFDANASWVGCIRSVASAVDIGHARQLGLVRRVRSAPAWEHTQRYDLTKMRKKARRAQQRVPVARNSLRAALDRTRAEAADAFMDPPGVREQHIDGDAMMYAEACRLSVSVGQCSVRQRTG